MITMANAARRQAFLSLFLAMTTGCSPKESSDMVLTQTLTHAAEAVGPGQALVLGDLVTQPWDQVILFGPYTPEEVMRKALGVELPVSLKNIKIDERDDVNALVFLNGKSLAAAVALPRRVADFSKTELQRAVVRAQARLVRDAAGVNFRWQGL